MKNTTNYVINFADTTITVSKKYLKEAGCDIRSEAYQTIKQLREDFPNFKIVEKEIKHKEGKQTYDKLNYKTMRQQIELREGKENAAAVLEEFEHIIQLSKVHPGPYAFVKTWFLNRYKDAITDEADFTKTSSDDESNLTPFPQQNNTSAIND